MATLYIDAGTATGDLTRFIAGELSDAQLDEIEIDRQGLRSDKLATEPITIAATITLATTSVVMITRLIERWMEKNRQLEQMILVANGFDKSDAAGKALADLSKANAKVSVSYSLATTPKQTTK